MATSMDEPRPQVEYTIDIVSTTENVPAISKEDSSTLMNTDKNNSNKEYNEVLADPSPTKIISSESSHGMDKDNETQVTDVDEEDEGETLVLPTIPSTSVEEEGNTRHKGSPFVYDPNKVSIRFLFANHDGLDVTVVCNPSDTVGQLKGQLLSLWPNDILSQGSKNITGDQLRLICMGKGVLGPDIRTLSECGVPIFETHATPVNVSVRPAQIKSEDSTVVGMKKTDGNDSRLAGSTQTSTDSCCVIL